MFVKTKNRFINISLNYNWAIWRLKTEVIQEKKHLPFFQRSIPLLKKVILGRPLIYFIFVKLNFRETFWFSLRSLVAFLRGQQNICEINKCVRFVSTPYCLNNYTALVSQSGPLITHWAPFISSNIFNAIIYIRWYIYRQQGQNIQYVQYSLIPKNQTYSIWNEEGAE